MLVLEIGLYARGRHVRVAAEGIEQLHRVAVVRHGVAGAVAPFPFADIVAYQFRLTAHTPCETVLPAFPFAVVRQRDDSCLKDVPCVPSTVILPIRQRLLFVWSV